MPKVKSPGAAGKGQVKSIRVARKGKAPKRTSPRKISSQLPSQQREVSDWAW